MHLFRIHGSTGPHAAADLIVVEIMSYARVGGVGWGNITNDLFDFNHMVHILHFDTYVALPHSPHTYVMLRSWTFSCTYTRAHTQTSCYAAGRSLAFPRIIRHATLLDVLPLLDSINSD